MAKMTRNFSTICRICLAEGSRNLFQATTGDALSVENDLNAINVSSLRHLIEKFRYVTLLQISEDDNLPHYICDMCVVQLNVAYNFKRNAIESNVYLQRYAIENDVLLTDNCMPMPLSSPSATAFPQMTELHIKIEPIDVDDDQSTSNALNRAPIRRIPTTGESRTIPAATINKNPINPVGKSTPAPANIMSISNGSSSNNSMVQLNSEGVASLATSSDISDQNFISQYLPNSDSNKSAKSKKKRRNKLYISFFKSKKRNKVKKICPNLGINNGLSLVNVKKKSNENSPKTHLPPTHLRSELGNEYTQKLRTRKQSTK